MKRRFSEWRKRTADTRSIGYLCLTFGVWGLILGVDIGLHLGR